jgi:leucyl aminopeptidase
VVQVVLDIATLTGACGVALGQETGGLFANTDSLATELTAAGGASGREQRKHMTHSQSQTT